MYNYHHKVECIYDNYNHINNNNYYDRKCSNEDNLNQNHNKIKIFILILTT